MTRLLFFSTFHAALLTHTCRACCHFLFLTAAACAAFFATARFFLDKQIMCSGHDVGMWCAVDSGDEGSKKVKTPAALRAAARACQHVVKKHGVHDARRFTRNRDRRGQELGRFSKVEQGALGEHEEYALSPPRRRSRVLNKAVLRAGPAIKPRISPDVTTHERVKIGLQEADRCNQL